MPSSTSQPIHILIAALGGEGGGVLSDWLITAATNQDLPVQSTSIPGVAQRTGATTYYLEILPKPRTELGQREPVLALYPGPGDIDLMVTSELLEVGRAIENGYLSPEKTTLIGSTHRVYAIAEKAAMSDQRYDAESIIKAANALAKQLILTDLASLAEQHNTALNAILLGAIAGSERLPIPLTAFEQAIEQGGIAVESNLRGFGVGLAVARGELEPTALSSEYNPPAAQTPPFFKGGPGGIYSELLQRLPQSLPSTTYDILAAGIERLIDYQDEAYAARYLDRLQAILALDKEDYVLSRETARYLALWMSYEDIIRVADLKTRPERFQRVRDEAQAKPEQPVHITEYVKPGVEEIAAILPATLGRRLRAWGRQRQRPVNLSMRVKTHTLWGFTRLWLLAKLRRWRRRSLRFQEEQALIERWLGLIQQATPQDYELALAIAECANLNKGYSDTFERGRSHFLQMIEELIEPALRGEIDNAAQQIRTVYSAALADPEGKTLQTVLKAVPTVFVQ